MQVRVSLSLFLLPLTIKRRFLQGDIINWERETWDLRSPWNRSVSETLDLEKDICNTRERGLFMVPQKLNFQESLHVCKKLAGKVISYTDRDEFDDIVYFLSLTPNMRSPACIDIKESSSLLQVWAGGSDEQAEGVWRTYDNNTSIQVNIYSSTSKVLKTPYSICHGERTDLTMMVTFITVL